MPSWVASRWIAAVVTLALIPVAWIFYGAWYSNALYQHGDLPRGIFFIVASLCTAGIFVLMRFVIRPEPIPFCGPSISTPDAAFCPRWKKISAGLVIFITMMGIVWVTLTAFISRQLPGFELLALLLFHWAGWLLCRPGWKNVIVQSWWHTRNWLALYVLFFCALILSSLWIYTHAQFQLWYLFPPAGAGMLLWTRRRYVPVVAWWVLAALALFSFRLNHWMYSVVGDEYIFLEYAETAALMPFAQLQKRLFNCCYVYGQHPFISSLFQAAMIKLTESATFGWRIANPLLCALSLPLFFSFFKTFVNRTTALTAVILLAGSAYLMSFSKIGYNNPTAFFGQALVLAATAWVLREESPESYVGLALAGGLCAYLYPAALYALIPPIILLLFYKPPVHLRRVLLYALTAAIFFATSSLLLLQPQLVPARVMGTYYFTHPLNGSVMDLVQHIAKNFVLAFFSGFHISSESHFVVSGYLDPFTAGLSLIGLVLTTVWARRERFATVVWLSFFAMLFLAGVSHDRTTPPTTRMFMLLPWFALFAALAIQWLVTALPKFRSPARYALLTLVLLTNVAQAYQLAPMRTAAYQTTPSLSLRLATNLERAFPGQERLFLFVSNPKWNPHGLKDVQKAYPQFLANTRIEDFNVSPSALSMLAERALPAETYVIEHESIGPLWRDQIAEVMIAAGKSNCTQSALTGEARFTLWYTPNPMLPSGPCNTPVKPLPNWVFWVTAIVLALVLDVVWVFWRKRLRKRQFGLGIEALF